MVKSVNCYRTDRTKKKKKFKKDRPLVGLQLVFYSVLASRGTFLLDPLPPKEAGWSIN